MVSRVFMICDAYESGFGHGIKQDGLDLSKTPHGDPEMGEAYQLGYEAGAERAAAPRQPAQTQSGRDFDVEQSARAIEATGDYELAGRLRHAWRTK